MQRAGGASEHGKSFEIWFCWIVGERSWREKMRPNHHRPRSRWEPPGSGLGPGPEGCGAIKVHEAGALTCFSESSFGKLRKRWM